MNEILALMHDTMGPVSTIQGAVETIKSGKLSQEEINRMLDSISERADRLNKILDDFYTSQKNKL